MNRYKSLCHSGIFQGCEKYPESRTTNGFTLIEVLVVMGILAILSTMGYLITIDFYKSYAFNAERDTIVSLLQKARAASLSNINESPHGVYFDDNYVYL